MTVGEANPDSLTDYYGEFSEAEVKALKKVVRDADGRKSEVKLAREALGMY